MSLHLIVIRASSAIVQAPKIVNIKPGGKKLHGGNPSKISYFVTYVRYSLSEGPRINLLTFSLLKIFNFFAYNLQLTFSIEKRILEIQIYQHRLNGKG